MSTSKTTSPKKCPVCGSQKISLRYADGVQSYNCDRGHVFIVEKKKRAA
jgi:hypothetical protein